MGANELNTIPPVPQEEYGVPPPTASLRRNHIRDSIRVAKGKPRPQPSKRTFAGHVMPTPEYPTSGFDLEPIMDAADPPSVPRYGTHNRKRSNTAPRAPPAFRSFSSHATLPSNYSANSSDIYAPSSIGASGLVSGQSSISRRTSEASGPSSIATNNFFDAVGTIRMEAFIDRVEATQQSSSRAGGHRSRGPRKGGESSSHYEPDFTRSEASSEVFYRNDDLFRGF